MLDRPFAIAVNSYISVQNFDEIATTMSIVQQVDPTEIGRALAQSFQGWHISNQTALGRTLSAIIPHHCTNGNQITEYIQSSNAVNINTDAEARQLGGPHGNFENLTINVRGGSAHCATTLCEIKNYVVPTIEYTHAKAAFLQQLHIHKMYRQNGPGQGRPRAGTIGADTTHYVDSYPAALLTPRYQGALLRAIELCKKLRKTADAGWRDPRSRQATEAQLEETLNQILYM